MDNGYCRPTANCRLFSSKSFWLSGSEPFNLIFCYAKMQTCFRQTNSQYAVSNRHGTGSLGHRVNWVSGSLDSRVTGSQNVTQFHVWWLTLPESRRPAYLVVSWSSNTHKPTVKSNQFLCSFAHPLGRLRVHRLQVATGYKASYVTSDSNKAHTNTSIKTYVKLRAASYVTSWLANNVITSYSNRW